MTSAAATDAPVPDSTGADRPARSDDVDISPVDDGYVVYDPRTDLVHHLNQTAAMVLELCTGEATVGDIAAFLAGLFPSADAVPETVTSCIGQLRGLGLVQPARTDAR